METEIIEPFEMKAEGGAITHALLEMVIPLRDSLDAVVYSGTAPAGCPITTYEEIQNRLLPKFSLVDAYKNLSLSFFKTEDILKINLRELENIKSRHPDFFQELEKLRPSSSPPSIQRAKIRRSIPNVTYSE